MRELEQAARPLVRPKSALAALVVAVGLVAGTTVAPAATGQVAEPQTPTSRIFTLSGADAERTSPASGDRNSRSLRVLPKSAGAGWSAALDVADGSQAVGVSWDGAGEGTVSVRGRAAGTGWTPWNVLDGDPGETADTSARTATEMVWFGAAGVDEVEIRVDAGHLPDLELQAIRSAIGSDPTASADAGAVAAAAAGDGRPSIQPRSAWTTKGWVQNPNCTATPVAMAEGVTFAVVHHTVNANTYSSAEVPAMLRAMYEYHVGTNRWCDIAYNFIVDRFGRIWEGNSGGVAKPIRGAHSKGFNTSSVGVSFLGQYQPGASPAAAAPTAAALTAAGQLIGWKLALHGHSPSTRTTTVSRGSPKYPAGQVVTLDRVSGHRAVQLTSCPGDLLYSQLAKIRATAVSYQASLPAAPAATRPFRIPGTLVTQGYGDVLARLPSNDRYAYWSDRVGSTVSPGAFLANLVQSTDADALLHGTTRLYRAYFLRNPDHAGFTYWTRQRAGGTTLARMSDILAGSSEFENRYGELTDAEFVDRVYRNVLGRPADSGGRSYWTRRLAAGTSRGEVMANFSQSAEYVRTTKSGNEVVALYETLLKRAVAPASYNTLVADLADGTRTTADVATSLFVSTSYRNRFAKLD